MGEISWGKKIMIIRVFQCYGYGGRHTYTFRVQPDFHQDPPKPCKATVKGCTREVNDHQYQTTPKQGFCELGGFFVISLRFSEQTETR